MDSAAPDRQAALRALTDALTNVVTACEQLQLAAVWTLEAYGSPDVAETVRMLPVGTPRPGRPAVPPPAQPPADPDSVTVTESQPCDRCDGSGKIANSDAGEPWTAWENLPPGSDLAVRMGLVAPIECPVCHGSGRS